MSLSQELFILEERVRQLEKHIHYPHNETSMKEAAAKAQSMQDMDISKLTVNSDIFKYAVQGTAAARAQGNPQPLTNDVKAIRELGALARRLLNPEDFGHAVTFEVRQAARRALGLPEVKEYDL